MLKGLQRDRWIASLLLLGLAALLVLVLRDYGVSLPDFPRDSQSSTGAIDPLTDKHLQELIATTTVPRLHSTNLHTPFYTTHFQPPKAPSPTTRKVNMIYQGFFQTTDGDRQAFVRVDDADRTIRLGHTVIADLAISDIQLRTLTLTNNADQTNVLEFNQTVAVEVPVP